MPDVVLERFWNFVGVDPISKCWNWTGGNVRGYGHFKYEGKTVKAHRFAYEVNKNKIAEGLTIDHLCRNPSCVNPEHMETVTAKVNVLRGNTITALNSKKTHCPNGHELKGLNLGCCTN